jgi:hypothetical protein
MQTYQLLYPNRPIIIQTDLYSIIIQTDLLQPKQVNYKLQYSQKPWWDYKASGIKTTFMAWKVQKVAERNRKSWKIIQKDWEATDIRTGNLDIIILYIGIIEVAGKYRMHTGISNYFLCLINQTEQQ